jgi:hypothetical protein
MSELDTETWIWSRVVDGIATSETKNSSAKYLLLIQPDDLISDFCALYVGSSVVRFTLSLPLLC